jgi:protein-S-isoprenylcysteine O-methyltransferase Ste14
VSTLVTKGPYRISRNPMYTGLAAAYVGAALWVGTWWPLIIAPLPVLADQRRAADQHSPWSLLLNQRRVA